MKYLTRDFTSDMFDANHNWLVTHRNRFLWDLNTGLLMLLCRGSIIAEFSREFRRGKCFCNSSSLSFSFRKKPFFFRKPFNDLELEIKILRNLFSSPERYSWAFTVLSNCLQIFDLDLFWEVVISRGWTSVRCLSTKAAIVHELHRPLWM